MVQPPEPLCAVSLAQDRDARWRVRQCAKGALVMKTLSHAPCDTAIRGHSRRNGERAIPNPRSSTLVRARDNKPNPNRESTMALEAAQELQLPRNASYRSAPTEP